MKRFIQSGPALAQNLWKANHEFTLKVGEHAPQGTAPRAIHGLSTVLPVYIFAVVLLGLEIINQMEKPMAALKIGDIVQLKSGGPKMTITKIFGDDSYQTSWFAGSKKEAGVFPSQSLVRVSDEQPK